MKKMMMIAVMAVVNFSFAGDNVLVQPRIIGQQMIVHQMLLNAAAGRPVQVHQKKNKTRQNAQNKEQFEQSKKRPIQKNLYNKKY